MAQLRSLLTRRTNKARILEQVQLVELLQPATVAEAEKDAALAALAAAEKDAALAAAEKDAAVLRSQLKARRARSRPVCMCACVCVCTCVCVCVRTSPHFPAWLPGCLAAWLPGWREFSCCLPWHQEPCRSWWLTTYACRAHLTHADSWVSACDAPSQWKW